MKNKITTVKLKEIYKEYGNDTFETKDKRINVKLPIIKVIKIALKYGFSFRVGWKDNSMHRNMDYIEITSRGIFDIEHKENWRMLEKYLLKEVLKNE